MRKIWPFTINVLLFGGMAAEIPFLVLYYQSIGFTGAQIGVLTGITPLIGLVSIPVWTSLADATGRHRLILSLGILLGAVGISLLPLVKTFLPVLLLTVLFYTAFSPIFSFVDNATMASLGEESAMYGRIRLGGTIGYGLSAAVVGVLVQSYGIKLAFWSSGILLLAGLIASQKLVFNPQKSNKSMLGNNAVLLADRGWLLFLLVTFIAGVGLSATNSYFFPYLNEMSMPESVMGFMLTIGTLGEMPIMFFGNHFIRYLKPFRMLFLAACLTGLRLVLFALSNTVSLVLVLQLLNGLTIPALWIAGVAYANEKSPAGQGATAQGHLSAMVFGFGPAVGGFFAGPLLESIGGHGLFLVYGSVVLAVLVFVLLARGLSSVRQQANIRNS
jgi:PPP family 3-phenylpropionic acid transporter